MGDYWLWHVRPDWTEEFAQQIDEGIHRLVETTISMSTASWTEFARNRMRLPLRMKGCGLREAVDRRHGQYMGAMLQSTMPLIDRTNEEGLVIAGRLNIPSIIDLFGEGSFDFPFDEPWEHLINRSRESCNLAHGLKHAWSHLTTSFQDVATPEQLSDFDLLLSQEVTRAGFYEDGTVAASVTKALTIELESARATTLGEEITTALGRDEYERWAWESCDTISGQFLLSPPDHFGYIKDTVFQSAFATYLGQACPIIAPVVGRFFGKDGKQLDKYGANLAAAALPGQGHRTLHNQLQALLQAMMKLGGIFSEKRCGQLCPQQSQRPVHQ